MRRNTFRKWLLPALLVLASLASADSGLLIELKGEPAPGALMLGQTRPGVMVSLDGQPLRVTPTGWFAFGFGRDDIGSRELLLSGDGQTESRQLTLTPREWDVQYVEGVPQETVTPPPERLERIRHEASLVRAARDEDSSLEGFLQTFIWPASGRLTGVYGSQRYYNGEPRRPHYGLDIAGPEGAPVYAPAGGKVSLVHDDMFYSGGTLVIDHGYGISSTFIHLQEILVEQGESVVQGQPVARIGSSGRSTGPHLDWRINWYQQRLDPQWFMGGTGLGEVQSPADQEASAVGTATP